jgi:hypothetical protein
MVIRQTKQGGVLAVAPRRTDAEPTPAQLAQQQRFRLGIEYAKGANTQPEYKALAERRQLSSFNVATADFLHPPEIHELDLSGYHGKPGDTIAVRATDDVAVKTVSLLIATDENLVVEQGLMQQGTADRTRWTYVATKEAGSSHVKVVVDAADMASQMTRAEAPKAL